MSGRRVGAGRLAARGTWRGCSRWEFLGFITVWRVGLVVFAGLAPSPRFEVTVLDHF